MTRKTTQKDKETQLWLATFVFLFAFYKYTIRRLIFLNLIIIFLINCNGIYLTHFYFLLSTKYHFIKTNLNATMWCLEKLCDNSTYYKLVHFPAELFFIMKTHITIFSFSFLIFYSKWNLRIISWRGTCAKIVYQANWSGKLFLLIIWKMSAFLNEFT